jgi:hypothetical protein
VSVADSKSFAATAGLVKSLNVVLRTHVPVVKETPLVLMLFAATGWAVPEATFKNFTVTVPGAPSAAAAAQIDQAAIVQA